MSLPGIKISYQNGKLGTVTPSEDGMTLLCAKGTSISNTLTEDTPYLIYSPAGLAELGVTSSTNKMLFDAVNQFYREAEEGTPLYVVVSDYDTMSEVISGALPDVLQSLSGRIRIVAILDSEVEPETESESEQEEYDHGIAQRVLDAVTPAQNLATNAASQMYAPILIILDGYGYYCADDLTVHQGKNRVAIVIGNEGATEKHAAIGLLTGRIASISVQRNIGRVHDGPINSDNLYLGSGKVSDKMDEVATIYDKGYICPRIHVGKSGCFWTDDRLLTELTDDYAHITSRRTVDKAVRIGYATLLDKLLDEVEINDDGTMQQPILKSWQQDVEDAINAAMTANGELVSVEGSGCECFIDPAQNVRSTSEVKVVICVRPFGYARTISAEFGFKVES